MNLPVKARLTRDVTITIPAGTEFTLGAKTKLYVSRSVDLTPDAFEPLPPDRFTLPRIAPFNGVTIEVGKTYDVTTRTYGYKTRKHRDITFRGWTLASAQAYGEMSFGLELKKETPEHRHRGFSSKYVRSAELMRIVESAE